MVFVKTNDGTMFMGVNTEQAGIISQGKSAANKPKADPSDPDDNTDLYYDTVDQDLQNLPTLNER